MNKLFSKIAVLSVGLAMALGVGIAVSQKAPVRAKADGGFTLVTSNGSLSNGDKVVIATKDAGAPVKGVTGWDGNKDAEVSNDDGGWIRYVVGNASGSGWSLYDEGAEKYIQTPTDNWFKYSDASSKATCSVSETGVLTANSRCLSINGSLYRFYKSTTTYERLFVWKVEESTSPAIELSSTEISLSVDNESGVTVTATPKNFTSTVVYSWSTTSESILLENTSTATVTIKPNTIVPGSATVSLSAYDNDSVPSSEPIVKQVTVNLVNYAGVYALSSKTTTYTSEVDNEKFHNLVNNSEAFTLVSATNFRLGASPNTTDIMLYGVSSTTLSVPAGYLIKTVVVNGYASETGGSTLSVGGVAKSVAQGAPYVDYSYYVFGQSVTITTTSRVWAKTITITVEKYVDVTVATDFEAAFLDMTAAECSAQKVTSLNWGDIKTVFGHISSDFAASAAIVKGHDESVAAIARYKYIIEKYGYEDFLNKGYVQLKNHSEYSALSNSSILTIVVITSALSAASFTLVLVLRKKKHN